MNHGRQTWARTSTKHQRTGEKNREPFLEFYFPLFCWLLQKIIRQPNSYVKQKSVASSVFLNRMPLIHMVEKQIKHQIFNSHLNQRGCPRTLSCPCLGHMQPMMNQPTMASITAPSQARAPYLFINQDKNLNHGCFSIYSGVNGRQGATATLDELLANI